MGHEAVDSLRNALYNDDDVGNQVVDENGDDDDDDDVNDFLGEDDYIDSDEEERLTMEKVSRSVTASSSSSSKILLDDGSGISVTNAAAHSLAGVSTSIKSPPNFSKVDSSLPLDRLSHEFPRYYEALTNSKRGPDSSSSNGTHSDDDSSSASNIGSGDGSQAAPRCIEVTISAGQMLFIPAGWFHEVRSVGGGSDGHLAFNYWFHPPDGTSFEKPYSTDFWPSDWKKRNLK